MFKVAIGIELDKAVAPMKRSAISISFLFRFKSLFMPTAISAAFLSNGNTSVFSRKFFQNTSWAKVVPI